MKIKMPLGDHVHGVRCPDCKRETVVYNGNYFCAACDWAMPEDESEEDQQIISAYLNQEFEQYETLVQYGISVIKAQEGMARMKFYMDRLEHQ